MNASVTHEPRVLLIVADSLMPGPLFKLMEEGKLPAFSFLAAHGFTSEMVSVFPTMSVVNDSTMLTGTYPDAHGIPGLVWFDPNENRLINYGDSFGNILKQGLLRVAKDAMIFLNERHLKRDVQTIHEVLAERHLLSASVNLMTRRGSYRHELRFPFDKLLGKEDITGPAELRSGFFTRSGHRGLPHPFNQYGYSNKVTEQMTLEIMREKSPPRLLVTYLSDPDKKIHKHGPESVEALYDIDRFIQHILDAYPTREAALKEWQIAVVGDSGQAPVVANKKRAIVSLEKLLAPYKLRGMGKAVKDADLALAVNERMVYVYPLHEDISLPQLASEIVRDDRVDLVAFAGRHLPEGENAGDSNEGNVTDVQAGRDEIGTSEINTLPGRVYVYTAHGHLHFQAGGTRVDPYGNPWELTGDADLLDLRQQGGQWVFGEYVDVFRQLYGAVHAQQIPALAVTAKPGFEFKYQSAPTHVGGGSHGGISKQEMIVPLIVGGTTVKPMHNRLVDLKDYLLTLLGEDPEQSPPEQSPKD
ncbi:alkaline phosphatase family protein [Numidum massiliense]|uniref:alkaline phosphatase family protein n=1 Tax=Numidum massiliense TaxID=1522315 RepID=UPI0006D54E94|nr:alkaline phosphatase family protein [Numidum massiliense]